MENNNAREIDLTFVRIANEKAERYKRNKKAEQLAKKEKLYEIITTVLGILVFLAIFLLMGIVGNFEFEAAKADAKSVTEVTTETTTKMTTTVEEITTEIVDAEQKTKFFDVPLSKDLQLHIFAECEKHNISPAFIVAMIERESNYDSSAIGDNGNSLGLMQIQPKWYQDKMSELGVTDLLNPYENVTLGVSIVADLFERYNDDVYTLLMEYNGGLAYANRMKSQGKTSEYALTIADRSYQLETETYGK